MSLRVSFQKSEAIPNHRVRYTFLVVLWLAACIAIPARNRFEKPGWDTGIYLQAVESMRHGHDPYADAIARQVAFHQAQAAGIGGPTPFSYVYAPITLPLLWLVAFTPLWVSAGVYWLVYAAGALTQVFAGFRFASGEERPVFLFFLPVAIFFPGLLASDIVWSGNIAFPLYGAVMAAALYGWSRNRWIWFYLAALIAFCFKAPLLTLLAIPVLTARKQWVPAATTALAGLGLFFLQYLFVPNLFRHYLQAVELQFSYNRDFGSSLAGLFSGFLFDHKMAYAPAAYGVYLAYALPVCGVLFWLSRLYLRGRLTLALWGPVLLLGVVLLNPRILEYDENLLALPMVLVLWRFFRALAPQRVALALSVVTFLCFNLIAYRDWTVWKLTEGPLLMGCFIAGVWTLHHYALPAGPEPHRAKRLPIRAETFSQV